MLKGTSLNTVAFRQLTVRAECVRLWFAAVWKEAALYKLECEALAAVVTSWSKKDWSTFIHYRVSSYLFNKCLRKASEKSTLSFLDLMVHNPQVTHHMWSTGGCPARSRVAASSQAKLITGSYLLPSNRS